MSAKIKTSTVAGLLALALLAFFSYGHAGPPRTLIKNNPFLPPGYNTKKPPPTRKLPAKRAVPPTLELRSIVKFDNVWSFSIYDKKTQKSKLVELDDKDAEYHVIDFNEKSSEIKLKTDTGTITLTQFEGSGVPMPITGAEVKKSTATTQRSSPSSPSRRRRVITPSNRKPQKKVYDMNTDELSRLFPPGHKKSKEELQKIIDNAKKARDRQNKTTHKDIGL